ncbi:MAG: hypothetical protein RL757_345 [Bacteroidota bacterium]|jgi:hypothetical protein
MIRKILLLLILCLKFSILCSQSREFVIQINANFDESTFKKNLSESFFDVKKIDKKSEQILIVQLNFVGETDKYISENQYLKMLLRARGVVLAQPNSAATLRNVEPNDPDFREQWYLQRTQVSKFWETTTGGVTACGDSIVVAVLDWGFDTSHRDLKQNIWKNKSEIPNNNLDDDQNGYPDDAFGWNTRDQNDRHTRDDAPPQYPPHGTACAGIIGAAGNNQQGISGSNWHVKLMLCSEARTAADIAASFEYIYRQRKRYRLSNGRQGAFVVAASVSVGVDRKFANQEPILCAWTDSLTSEGVIIVNAPPNQNVNIENIGDLPSLCPTPRLINITSTDQSDRRKPYAYSKNVIHIAAPGSEIWTSFPRNNATDIFSGNSFAAPQVAGAVALLWALPNGDTLCKMSPTAAADLVREAILNGGDALTTLENTTQTGKRLNLEGSRIWLKRRWSGARTGALQLLGVFPNPAKNIINLNVQATDNQSFKGKILMQNSLGQLVFSKAISYSDLIPPSISVDISNFSAGMYQIWLESETEISVRIPIIIVF